MKKVCFIILVSCESSLGNIQQDSVWNGLSLEVRGGVGLLGIAGDIAIQHESKGGLLFGVRCLGSKEFAVVTILTEQHDRPFESVWEIDGYFGKTFLFSKVRLSGTVGLCVTGGVFRGALIKEQNQTGWFAFTMYRREILSETVVGVPMQAQLSILPTSHFGISITYHLNINSRRNFRGFMFSLQFSTHPPPKED